MSLFGDLPQAQPSPPRQLPIPEPSAEPGEAAPPAKRARPEPGPADEVLAALARLSAHAEAPPKKAAKVAQLFSQLLAGGSLKRPHAAAAFALLEALMRDPGRCAAPETRVEYAAMLAAVAAAAEQGVFNAKQRPWVALHRERAELCAKLAADDSHSFARAAADVRTAFAQLPDAAVSDDAEAPVAPPPEALAGLSPEEAAEAAAMAARFAAAEAAAAAAAAELASARRDMLLDCVEVAFSRYKHAWAAATVDVLIEALHTSGLTKLPPQQRSRLNAIVNRAREARRLRKAGGGGGAEPGPTSFERSERAFAGATFSIRKAIGASLGTDGRGDSSAFGGGGPQA